MSKIDKSAIPTMPRVDGNSRIFGVIAHPVTHVRAPMVFNPRFASAGLGHIMLPIDAPPASLQDIIRGLQSIPNFGGLAVTIPHKLAMAELCDDLRVARLTGAVNAVRFGTDGLLYGDNFDGAGFVGCRAMAEVTERLFYVCWWRGAGDCHRFMRGCVGQLTIANRTLTHNCW